MIARISRIFLIVALFGGLIGANTTQAAPPPTPEELKAQINDRQTEINKLNALIANQEKALNETSKQATSLQTAVKTADLTVKKLTTEVTRTETGIKQTALQLEKLVSGIQDTAGKIEAHEATLRVMLRQIAEDGREDLPQILAHYDHFSDFLADSGRRQELQEHVFQATQELRQLKVDLGEQAAQTEASKAKSLKLKQELVDQQKIVAAERTRQDKLLTETKSQEAAYQKQLAETKARKDAFTRELQAYEAQLRLQIDPSLLPTASAGILSWPLANVFITQQFGATAAAKRLYASGTHNGIDLRASVGTPVMAAAAGTVAGTGDTDLTCKGASYGRWVLIKHDNGLATLSAHLSLIKVTAGERVAKGTVIGYAGQTGYATGPHLHFTVAAAQGVVVQNLKSTACPNSTYTMPIFDARAYLDPVLYLGA